MDYGRIYFKKRKYRLKATENYVEFDEWEIEV